MWIALINSAMEQLDEDEVNNVLNGIELGNVELDDLDDLDDLEALDMICC